MTAKLCKMAIQLGIVWRAPTPWWEAAAVSANCARAAEPAPSDRLRVLARRIERLAVAGRVDPETIVIEKLAIARSLRRLAVELEARPP